MYRIGLCSPRTPWVNSASAQQLNTRRVASVSAYSRRDRRANPPVLRCGRAIHRRVLAECQSYCPFRCQQSAQSSAQPARVGCGFPRRTRARVWGGYRCRVHQCVYAALAASIGSRANCVSALSDALNQPQAHGGHIRPTSHQKSALRPPPASAWYTRHLHARGAPCAPRVRRKMMTAPRPRAGMTSSRFSISGIINFERGIACASEAER